MEEDIKKIFSQAKEARLNPEEFARLKKIVISYLETHPVRDDKDSRHLSQQRSSLVTLLQKPMAAVLSILVIAAASGGLSLAAENTLPGDTLYPLKVGVNEEVRGWLAVSSEAKAEWETRRVERRLEEAAKLVAEGRLNAETEAQIETRFEAHAERAKERLAELEAEQNTDATVEVSSKLETSLKVHENILGKLTTRDAATSTAVKPILGKVRTTIDAVAKTREQAEGKVSAKAEAELQAAARGRMKAAQNKINEVRAAIERARAQFGAEATARAEVRLASAEELFLEGKARLESAAAREAIQLFQKATVRAQEAKLLLRAKTTLNVELELNGSAKTTVESTPSPAPSLLPKEVNGEGKEDKVEAEESLNLNINFGPKLPH